MGWTLEDIQRNIANEIDQSDTSPTVGGADWTIRLDIINRALRDWAETYDWDELHKIHNGLVSTSLGNASYALPSDFRKLDGFPRIVSDGLTAYDFPEVNPSNNLRYTDSDKFVNLLGNPNSNRVMYIHSSTLSSGASVQFTYWASPASLTTGTQVAEIPDASYLVQKTLYYIYKGREDGRFPEAKVEADRILARMIENQNTRGISSTDRRVSVNIDPYKNWRIGNSG